MNATEHGRAFALTILGDDRPYTPVPFAWTDHYDVRIQLAGHVPHEVEPAPLMGGRTMTPSS